jgi:hypothetical protein
MRPPPATAPWLLPILASLVAAPGCTLVTATIVARGPSADTRPADAAGQRPAPRTIPLEVTFVRCAADDVQLREELWRHVDEQALDDERRRALNANGLRAGVVTGQLPEAFAARLSTADAEPADVAGIDASHARRLLHLLPGRGSELVTATHLPSLVLLERRDGQVRGGTYHDATPQFALDARPAADGRVRLELVPEVRHGPVEKSWAGEDGAFRLETGQRRHRMEHLGIDVTVPAGGMLLVGCGGEPSATVGDGLLRDHGDSEENTVRLIAIRPLVRSTDPVFAEPAPIGDEDDDAPLTVE